LPGPDVGGDVFECHVLDHRLQLWVLVPPAVCLAPLTVRLGERQQLSDHRLVVLAVQVAQCPDVGITHRHLPALDLRDLGDGRGQRLGGVCLTQIAGLPHPQ
jgi:hypothetical protein